MTKVGARVDGGARGRVLVVDDDLALAEMLGIVLRGEGFEPVFCSDGSEALRVFRESRPDIVLLDLMLPGKDGVDVCRLIRAESGTPIVMLTAKSDTVDVVVGLEAGADDYIVKPFKPKELVARVRARMRRSEDSAPAELRIADLIIDVAGHSVRRGELNLSLTPLEFDLLLCLARKPGQVFTREALAEWGLVADADADADVWADFGGVVQRRRLVGEYLGVGDCDGRQLLRQMNLFFTEDEAREAIEALPKRGEPVPPKMTDGRADRARAGARDLDDFTALGFDPTAYVPPGRAPRGFE